MSNRTCSIDGCEGKHLARGWCGKHYDRWKRHGDPNVVLLIRNDVETRFWSYVVQAQNGCWLWTGYKVKGYGRISLGRHNVPAHRWAYEHLIADIPEGLELDHLCRIPACVNPWHLDPVPGGINILRGYSPSAVNARKSHCSAGHPYDDENTYWHKGKRHCRACRRESHQRATTLLRELKAVGV